MKRHVALIGFMAAGKTTIGKRLGRDLGLDFVDTDAIVVARHGPIDEIFAAEGEARFRDYEFEAVQEALTGDPKVISLGGGAVTHEPTRNALSEHALRVFLEVPVTTIIARVRRASTIRPILGTQPTLQSIKALLSAREPFYREAEITVEARGTTSKIARTIATRLSQLQTTN